MVETKFTKPTANIVAYVDKDTPSNLPSKLYVMSIYGYDPKNTANGVVVQGSIGVNSIREIKELFNKFKRNSYLPNGLSLDYSVDDKHIEDTIKLKNKEKRNSEKRTSISVKKLADGRITFEGDGSRGYPDIMPLNESEISELSDIVKIGTLQ